MLIISRYIANNNMCKRSGCWVGRFFILSAQWFVRIELEVSNHPSLNLFFFNRSHKVRIKTFLLNASYERLNVLHCFSFTYAYGFRCWLNKISQTYFLLLPIYGVLCFNIWTFCQVAGIIFTVNKLSQSSNTYFKVS